MDINFFGDLVGEIITNRPQRLCDFIGQEKVKENLEVFIQAAKMRNEPLDHILLHGSPGLGKTTLASIIANEMGQNLRIITAQSIVKVGDLTSVLTSLQNDDIVLIDEIDRLNEDVKEMLSSAMEDFAIDIILGKGPSASSIRLDLPHFTLVASTEYCGKIRKSLLDCFGITLRLDPYSVDDIAQMIARRADSFDFAFDDGCILEIASHCKGKPRNVNILLERIADYAKVKGLVSLSKDAILDILDNFSLDDMDYLNVDFYKYKDVIALCNGSQSARKKLIATLKGVDKEQPLENIICTALQKMVR